MLRLLLIAVTAVVFSLAVSSCGGVTEDSGTRVDPVHQGVPQGWPNGTTKVTICHVPPGNPANAHTITVGAPAVPAHLQHGDSIGACAFDGGGGDDHDGGCGGGDGGGGGGGGGGDDGGDDGGPDGGSPGACLPVDAACPADTACCTGLACVDSMSNPCAADACTCQVIIN